MHYVTMTDEFMSGWGKSENKINRLVFECESEVEAKVVYQNAKDRGDQTHIHIRKTKPHYSKEKFYVQFKDKDSCPHWYKADYFKLQKQI